MPVTNITLGPPTTDPLVSAAMIQSLQLLVYALVATNPDPRAVSDHYQTMWGDYLERLGNLPPTTPHQLESMHAAHHLITRVLDQFLAKAPRA